MDSNTSGKALLGVVLKDWLRYRRAISTRGQGYLGLCNRDEQLEPGPGGLGYRCKWRWTSDLHAPMHLRSLGLAILRRAIGDHPVRLRAKPVTTSRCPQITYLIGHRGVARLPHLNVTLQSIAAQDDADVECIVIEQDERPVIGPKLPDWVRYVHSPTSSSAAPYCRASTFNIGARLARGSVLVLHDNDILVPSDYSSELLRRHSEGFEVINLKRFIFYLGARQSRQLFEDATALTRYPPDAIMQNAEAGGSIAISTDAFARIGGMDERFVGWGGEDNEFWERAQTLRVWPYGYLSLIHLWHDPQPEKLQARPPMSDYYAQRSAIPVEARIAELVARHKADVVTRQPSICLAGYPMGN